MKFAAERTADHAVSTSILLEPTAGASSKDILHQPKISFSREIRLAQCGLALTFTAAALLFWQIGGSILQNLREQNFRDSSVQFLFLLVAASLIYGNIVYHLTRIGYMRRLKIHAASTTSQSLPQLPSHPPTLTILVPSYKEDPEVVRRTLLSAALQCYPGKRIVLLIDDPAVPASPHDRALLHAALQLPHEIQSLLHAPATTLDEHLRSFLDRRNEGPLNFYSETLALAQAHAFAATWLTLQADDHRGTSHSDTLFLEQTFREPASRHQQKANHLETLAAQGGPYPSPADFLAEYRALAARFQSSLSSFQRKKYVNLSHEANKAMNLNSYIGLLGQSFVETPSDRGLLLQAATSAETPSLVVPPSDFLVTLDADSILAPDYAQRLIDYAGRPENARVAVVQTPYSAEPNPPGLLERVAGATTDIQYLIHQGFTHYNATFWVGANALLRTSALRDIAVTETERGFTVTRFIQDRTVIEDTESSIDLAARGWKLYNFPERLSHSATPADFGSLLIQRRRWANGGLIILPKLLGYLFHFRGFFSRARESFFRLHYLTSIAAVNLALPIMLLFPFEKNLRNIWFPLTCISYFLLYTRDLLQAHYRVSDLFRVYALNLLLVPVNLGGVFKSLQQSFTKAKIPFSRTPKISGRTTAPAGYLIVIYFFALYCFTGVVVDSLHGRWFHAAFGLLNGLFFFYAIAAFIGFRNSAQDILAACPTFSRLLSRFRPREFPALPSTELVRD